MPDPLHSPNPSRPHPGRSAPDRSLPERPSLRYLKLEAKRRVAAGEFPALHEAQLAIAREHGLAGWAALKQAVGEPDGPALAQLRWVLGRFRGAGSDGWIMPDEAEMREHFADIVFHEVPPTALAASIA